MGPVVASRRCADFPHAVDAHIDGRIESQRHFGIGQVIVDGPGNADAWNAHFTQAFRAGKAAVPADYDQAVNFHGAQGPHSELPVFELPEFVATGRPQIGSCLVRDIQNGFQMQLLQVVPDVGALSQQSVISAFDADQRNPVQGSTSGDGIDGCVHAGAVAAAGQDADFSHHSGFAPFPPAYPEMLRISFETV